MEMKKAGLRKLPFSGEVFTQGEKATAGLNMA
jgi:hypothetical protein